MESEKKEKGLLDFLTEHMREEPTAFHMPGHKGEDFYRRAGYGDFLDRMVSADITEIHGADNLFQAEDVILTVMKKYEKLYRVRKSYLLINGTSGGILAAVMAAVPKGKKLILTRNCHKSVFNALALAGAEPVYAYPELIPEYGISGALSAEETERLLSENPDAEAVILPSPNYYGICSDIRRIAEVVHRAGKILIVDQAHGAHLRFFSEFCRNSDWFPKSAEEQGADITINSIHKTLGSFTQSAVMNVNSDRVDLSLLEDRLQMVESTSPSYLLMASLEMNADILQKNGRELFSAWEADLRYFSAEAEKIRGLTVMKPFGGIFDGTKLNLDMSRLGLSGEMLDGELRKRGIYTELVTGNIVMCMTGIGNVRKDYEKLLAALSEIADLCGKTTCGNSGSSDEMFIANERCDSEYPDFGTLRLHPVPRQKEKVSLREAGGRICASSIIPYPPGIPIACPGEEITAELAEYIRKLRARGEKVIGVTEDGCVLVGTAEIKNEK